MRDSLLSRGSGRLVRRLTRGACRHQRGLTLVEMLVAMAVTLLIMAAVVTVFANISGSVTRRRATIELSSALRNVRELLAQDLAGATCSAVPWRRPEANEGYLEIIEGPFNDAYPTPWLWCPPGASESVSVASLGAEFLDVAQRNTTTSRLTASIGTVPGIDLEVSTLPGSTLRDPRLVAADDDERYGRAVGSNLDLPDGVPTDGRGLGDGDDILMLTVRNEAEPFVGRVPDRARLTGQVAGATAFGFWPSEAAESPLAEIAWFALENPVERADARTFAFGEPGFRTIYRRVLLILPEIDYGYTINVGGQQVAVGPGVVRVLDATIDRTEVPQALASLIAFQERFDLSVRLEWSETFGRWFLRANTLGDLTKRENRYEHHGLVLEQAAGAPFDRPALNNDTASPERFYPFAVASGGRYTGNNARSVLLVTDPELVPPVEPADYVAVVDPTTTQVVAYNPVDFAPGESNTLDNRRYATRPLAIVQDDSDQPATARAVLDEDGHVVHVTRGLAPLGGASPLAPFRGRRGDDIVLTDALAFDLRLFDPGAPMYGFFPGGDRTRPPESIVQPGDPAWPIAYARANPTSGEFALVNKQGAYVDAGYNQSFPLVGPPSDGDAGRIFPGNRFAPALLGGWADFEAGLPITPRFAGDGLVRLATVTAPRTTAFGVFDTWSWHYESNGLNEDFDVGADGGPMIDEGTNSLDDRDPTLDADLNLVDSANDVSVFGPDDPAERETRPPYASALRGMQVTLRVYEQDSRQIREVRVRESFVPE